GFGGARGNTLIKTLSSRYALTFHTEQGGESMLDVENTHLQWPAAVGYRTYPPKLAFGRASCRTRKAMKTKIEQLWNMGVLSASGARIDGLPGDDGLLDASIGLEQHQVGVVSGREQPLAMSQAERHRRIPAAHGRALWQRERGGIAEGHVEGQNAACERPI